MPKAKAKTKRVAVQHQAVDVHTDPVVVHDQHVFWELMITAIITALILLGGISWWQRTQTTTVESGTTTAQ